MVFELPPTDVADEFLQDKTDEINTKLCDVYERLESLEAATAKTRAAKILDGLGFSVAQQNKATKEFSGGWRMRIALARALFVCPTFLIQGEQQKLNLYATKG